MTGVVYPTADLDPKPYRRMMGDQRYPSRKDAPNNAAFVFDPRRGYSQDEADYVDP